MNEFINQSKQYSVYVYISAFMSRRQSVMLGISPPVIHRVTSGLDTFSSDDDSDSDSDSDIDRDDPSDYLILWGQENEVYHDNALVYTMPRPSHVQVNHLFD
jgi:hypothetical protein